MEETLGCSLGPHHEITSPKILEMGRGDATVMRKRSEYRGRNFKVLSCDFAGGVGFV